MTAISNRTIADCLTKYGVQANEAQCERVRSYISLLLKWNKSISLTSVTGELEILKFHFGESVFALSAVGGIGNGRLADVGTGAGFPGLPLKIFSEPLDLALIEPNAKKCAFLSEAVRSLGFSNVRVLRERFEHVTEYDGKLNTVVSRALGAYDDVISWARKALASDGQVALWIGEDDARKISGKAGWAWKGPVAIPGSRRRFILSGQPMQ